MLWNLQMIELRTQGLFVSLKRVCSGFVCFLRRFCSPWKGKCCMKICLPMLGRSCKDNCKVWQEACIEWNSHDYKILWIPADFFCQIDFFQILMEAGWKICAFWSRLIKSHSTIDDALSRSTKVSKGSISYFFNIGKTIRADTAKNVFIRKE